ncbi:UDP-glucose--hexose-1-phosphate uridylyltransferase [Jeotgalibaca caeni]|uniref:UDP-glucose--hexose-1-phosphate uridylyltransferase n=1 Tax=Jeotgalibaca caeni TaxID=3028623 RepID=UPI00237DDD57|nr:UDP-glucose--hexose-1-phosphate uridylyltransferase [Jeotgalibaca caeni]MDE1548224.1 UDP-glucose--hexose-1-phosphate uridylyltransferase [Jeotgalibaca caeni]
MNVTIDQAIVDIIEYGVEKTYIHPLDRILKQNQLLALLQKDSLVDDISPSSPLPEAKDLLPIFVEHGRSSGLIDDSPTEQMIFTAQVMAFLTPDPSALNDHFWKKYQETPAVATDYFYQLSMDNDYIQTEAIAKNIQFHYDSDYGDLELTINLSKPEKDPKAIAAARTVVTAHYPKCQLCVENEGYKGNLQHPARANHRIVRFPLNEEIWGLQYSPYAYYTEHCIFLAEEHRPMKIGEHTFRNLLAIVGQFPHYFAGSNADLPIVGGSILSHDHYQGGRYTFAMEKAPLISTFKVAGFPDITGGMVKWPLSVIRLEGSNPETLVEASTHILEKWRAYSDETVGIHAFTNDTPHNTITPIARRNGEQYVMDLVLRNNRTTETYPDGLFHPHPDVQHIKKENIGLIEVMGLAILPPRLKEELADVADYLLGETQSINPIHLDWADSIPVAEHATREEVEQAVEQAVGAVFQRVLEDAGVFKLDETGLAAFERFIKNL